MQWYWCALQSWAFRWLCQKLSSSRYTAQDNSIFEGHLRSKHGDALAGADCWDWGEFPHSVGRIEPIAIWRVGAYIQSHPRPVQWEVWTSWRSTTCVGESPLFHDMGRTAWVWTKGDGSYADGDHKGRFDGTHQQRSTVEVEAGAVSTIWPLGEWVQEFHGRASLSTWTWVRSSNVGHDSTQRVSVRVFESDQGQSKWENARSEEKLSKLC